MLRSFVEWLDGYLAGEEPSAVVKAVVGILSFASLLGAILGSTAVRLGAFVAVLLTFLSIMLILLRDRRRLNRRVEEYRQAVLRYCDVITQQRKPAMRIRRLEHVVFIDRSGNVKEIITMVVIPLKKELHYIPHIFGPAWSQPFSQLKKIKIEVRGLSIDGKRGTKWFTTSSWRPDGKMVLLAHLNSPAPEGSEVYMEIIREWPGKCIPLIRDGHPDLFTYDYTRPIDYLSYVVVLPAGLSVYYDPIGFTEGDTGYSLNACRNKEGCTEVTMIATDVPVDRKIGMCLEIK